MRGVQVTRKKRIASLIAALIIAIMSTMVFISANAASDTYVPRLTAPSSDNGYYFSNKNIFTAQDTECQTVRLMPTEGLMRF